ncbi:flippase-like domain-containing protein, partial [Azospirillum oleiclasticum]
MRGGAGRRAVLAVQAAVTLAAVAALGWLVDWPGVLAALTRTDPAALLGALALAMLSQGLGAWRLSLVLDGLGLRLGLRRSLAFTWAGLFTGNVLPATVGADALFAVLLGRSGFPVGSGVIGIVYNRAVNVAVVLLCLPAALAALHVEASLGGRWAGGRWAGGVGPAGSGPGGVEPWPLLALAAGLLAAAAVAGFGALRLARRRWPE